jgi:hypothetical protein
MSNLNIMAEAFENALKKASPESLETYKKLYPNVQSIAEDTECQSAESASKSMTQAA